MVRHQMFRDSFPQLSLCGERVRQRSIIEGLEFIQSRALLAHHFRVFWADQDPALGSDATQAELEIDSGPAIRAVSRPSDGIGTIRRHRSVPCAFDGVRWDPDTYCALGTQAVS
jgi:hypothetical protein